MGPFRDHLKEERHWIRPKISPIQPRDDACDPMSFPQEPQERGGVEKPSWLGGQEAKNAVKTTGLGMSPPPPRFGWAVHRPPGESPIRGSGRGEVDKTGGEFHSFVLAVAIVNSIPIIRGLVYLAGGCPLRES